MKIVYTCFSTDIIHEGHLNILEEASKYGKVIIGALTDKALVSFSRFPTVLEEARIKLYEELDHVSQVIIQDSIYYDHVIAELHPDYIIHGDNWREGPEKIIRNNFLDLCQKYGG